MLVYFNSSYKEKGKTMKNGILILCALFLTACATANYTTGSDFKTDKVDQIEKGVTTKEQVADWFGEPYSKTVINGNQIKWLYFYSQGTSKAQSYVFTMKVQTEGTQKTLDILFDDGIVSNYRFTNGAAPQMSIN